MQWKTYTNTPKCKIYYFDFYGKRKDKYRFLCENTLDSIAWQELKSKAPFYLFIPQNEDLKEKYNKGWSVKDIFRVSGVGITTAHDEFVIDSSKEKLLSKFEDFKNSAPNALELHKKFNVKEKQGWNILKGWQNLQNQEDLSKFIKKIIYRPFDERYIFYEEKLVWRCVKDVMQHFLDKFKNFGLICNRSVALNDFHHSFITNEITDLHILETANASAYIFLSIFILPHRQSKPYKKQTTAICLLR